MSKSEPKARARPSKKKPYAKKASKPRAKARPEDVKIPTEEASVPSVASSVPPVPPPVDDEKEERSGKGEGATCVTFTWYFPRTQEQQDVLDAELEIAKQIREHNLKWAPLGRADMIRPYPPATNIVSTDQFYQHLLLWSQALKGLRSPVRYCVCQVEICPSTGRVHVQGYLETKRPMVYKAIHQLFLRAADSSLVCPGSFFVKSIATADENKQYCTKLGTEPRWLGKGGRAPGTEPVEWGKAAQQGERTDRAKLTEMLLECKSMTAINKLIDKLRSGGIKGYNRYDYDRTFVAEHIEGRRKELKPMRTEFTTCYWVYGPSNTLKSAAAIPNLIAKHIEDYDQQDDLYMWPLEDAISAKHHVDQKYHAYAGQRGVLIDDMAPTSAIPLAKLKQHINYLPHDLRNSGAKRVNFNPNVVVITSEFSPFAIYPSIRYLDPDDHTDDRPFHKRINVIRNLAGGGYVWENVADEHKKPDEEVLSKLDYLSNKPPAGTKLTPSYMVDPLLPMPAGVKPPAVPALNPALPMPADRPRAPLRPPPVYLPPGGGIPVGPAGITALAAEPNYDEIASLFEDP